MTSPSPVMTGEEARAVYREAMEETARAHPEASHMDFNEVWSRVAAEITNRALASERAKAEGMAAALKQASMELTEAANIIRGYGLKAVADIFQRGSEAALTAYKAGRGEEEG